jgi:dolichyl-diphosphooligosaccharide--protein glycosyltransferase
MQLSQVKAFFSRVWDGISSRITRPQVKREHLLLYGSLVLLVIGAFLVRIYPIFSTDLLLKGLDPWVQWRSAEYILEHGVREFLNWYDQSSWYPFGKAMGKSLYIVIPLTGVIFYKIAMFLGIGTSLYAVTYFVPAIFGTATILVIYKLGEIIHSKRTGVLAAFFLALANGFLSRTIVGFYDNECVGIFLMFLTFYFFLRGLTKDSMLHSVLAGLCLGGLSLTWGAFRYAYELLALYALLMILLKKYSRRLLSSFSITILIGLFMGTLIPRNGVKFLFATEQLIPLALIVVMLVITLYQELQKNIEAEKLKRIVRYTIFGTIGVGVVAIIVLYALGEISPIAAKFIRTIIPTLKESIPLIDSVAENLTSSWANLFFNIYIMVFLLPLGFYFCIKKPNEKTVFLLLMGLTGVYFGASMVRLALIVTPAAAVVAGYTLDEVLRPFALISQERFTISRRKRRAVKQIGRELISVTYVFVAVALMLTVIFGANILKRQYFMNHELTPRLSPQGGGPDFVAHDYQEMFDYLRVNIAPYSVGEKPPIVMSWWDYGYQLSVLGNVTTLVDNATVNSTQIGIVGAMLMHNESSSLKLLKKFGVDYVLVLSPGVINSQSNDLLKSQWMMQISETEATQYLHEYSIKYEDYFNDDVNSEEYGFKDLFWESVVYKLCAYKLNSDGIYEGSGAQVSNWRYGLLANAPDIKDEFNSLRNFKLVFQSQFAMLRLYQVMY